MDYELSKFTTQELCRIYNTLNGWAWPKLLGQKPERWDKLPNFRKSYLAERLLPSKNKIIYPIMDTIIRKVGRKVLLEWHWVHNLGKTSQEFETWYDVQISNAVLCPRLGR